MSQGLMTNEGDTDPIVLFAEDVKSDPLVGATIVLSIQDVDTGQYFDGAAFGAAFAEVTMTEVDATNKPGEYIYYFNPSAIGVNNIRVTYRARVAGSVGLDGGPWYGQALFGKWLDDLRKTKKYATNRVVINGGRYDLYEDDQLTIFEQGTSTVYGRDPD